MNAPIPTHCDEKISDAADIYLNVDDAALAQNVHRNTIYRALIKGNLPAEKVGGRWSIRRSELTDWADEWHRRRRGLNPSRVMPGESIDEFTRAMMRSRRGFDFELHAREHARVTSAVAVPAVEEQPDPEPEPAAAGQAEPEPESVDMSVLIP